MNYLRNTAGLPCTKDSAEISVYNRSALTSLPEKEHGSVPLEFNLYQNYPNPFNPSTSIEFQIANRGSVKLTVYDVLGNEIQILVNEELNSGTYRTEFNASNLASGIYFYHLESGTFTETRKMIVVK